MTNTPHNLCDAARDYLRAGLCVLPAILDEKRPAVGSWKAYQQCLPSEAQIEQWFSATASATTTTSAPVTACCLLTGTISGNLEMIDFDAGGALFDSWAAIVEVQAPGLLIRLVIERSRRGGKHVVYRCRTAVCGNLKLAQRRNPDNGGKLETLIETRGEGGLFLCAPSPGYEILQGDLAAPPVIDESERDILLSAAWSLNESWKRQDSSPMVAAVAGRPGDDFNERGDVRALLLQHGWSLARQGDNEYWRRPGKSVGSSATLKDNVFYVFSSNASPFEPERAYAPFTVYALLEHAGDYAAAAASLRAKGYGAEPDTSGVDLSAFGSPSNAGDDTAAPTKPSRRGLPDDPGPVPEELLDMPGFVKEVVDYTLRTAPYPDKIMSFCAAVALQALLAGRKVKDAADNRTSLYILGLANSGVGKDHPRKVNQKILMQAGLHDNFADSFASGEAIEDRMLLQPAMLFQTDEIDGLITAIARGQEARYEGIMNILLKMYTSANGVYAMRIKAGKFANRGVVDQPCLCLFGTAIPTLFYESMSAKMLNNGFFARMLVVEANSRPDGQDPDTDDELPASIVNIARHWAQLRTTTGNLGTEHPKPKVVPQTENAKSLLAELRQHADQQYRKAEKVSDNIGMAIWARANEKARRLALVYACSDNHAEPVVNEVAASWAARLVTHQTHRMLYMAKLHVADNPFHAECLKIIRMLQAAPGQRMQRGTLLHDMHCKAADFDQIIGTLLQQGEVVSVVIPSKTKPAQGYQLS